MNRILRILTVTTIASLACISASEWDLYAEASPSNFPNGLSVKPGSSYTPRGLPYHRLDAYMKLRCTNILRESPETAQEVKNLLGGLTSFEQALDARYPDPKGRRHRVVITPGVIEFRRDEFKRAWYQIFWGDLSLGNSRVQILDSRNDPGFSNHYDVADRPRKIDQPEEFTYPSGKKAFLVYTFGDTTNADESFDHGNKKVQFWTKAMQLSKTIEDDEVPVFVTYFGMSEAKLFLQSNSINAYSGLSRGNAFDYLKGKGVCPAGTLLDDVFFEDESLSYLRKRFGFMEWNRNAKMFKDLTEYSDEIELPSFMNAGPIEKQLSGFFRKKFPNFKWDLATEDVLEDSSNWRYDYMP